MHSVNGMNGNRPVAVGLLIVLVVSGIAVALVVLPPLFQPDVRIGYLSQDLHQLALRMAVEKGWFKEAGLNVELDQFANGGYEMDGFLGGAIDMGYLGAAPAMTKKLNQQINVKVLATANLEGSALMVDKAEYEAGHIQTMDDLVGKTIMQPGPSTVQNFLLRLALNQSGLSADDVLLSTQIPQYMASLLTADTPAFIAWEPFPALAEYNGLAVPLLLSEDIWPRHPCCVLAVSDTFLNQHSDIVEKVVDIHKKAEAWIAANRTDAIAVAVDWLQQNVTPVETAFDRIIYDYNVNRTALQRYLEFLIDEEIVSLAHSEIDAFLDQFIDTTYLED